VFNLTAVGEVRALLQRHGLKAQKKYGQNFLVDKNTLDKIVNAAQLEPTAQVLEIGAGLGTLTVALAAVAQRVVALEIDKRLAAPLAENLAGYSHIELIIDDALKVNLNSFFTPELPRYVVANLPYYIATPLLVALLELAPPPRRLVLLLQKEVGERLTAAPGSKSYGSLGVLAQAYAKVELAGEVPPTVFYPCPEVASCLVVLTPEEARACQVVSRRTLELTNRAIFGQRRKQLLKALLTSPHWQLDNPEEVALGLTELGIDPRQRGEELEVREIVALANRLHPCIRILQ